MPGTLHQILSADPRPVSECLAIAQAGDLFVLADDGVVLIDHSWPELSSGLPEKSRVMASSPDLAARGLERLAGEQGITAASDREWLALVIDCERVLSWK